MAINDHLATDPQPRHDVGEPPARILIVDDDEHARALAEGALSTVKDFEVQAESSAPRARELARRWRPDAIILDIAMPEIHGIALAKLLRADGCDAELMFLTGDEKMDTKEEGLEIANDYLTKPYNSRELVMRVRVLLRNRRQRGAYPLTGPRVSNPDIDALRPTFDETSDRVRIPRGRDARLRGYRRRLLLALLAGEGKPVPTRRLYEAVWQADCNQEPRPEVTKADIELVQVTINRLRSQIEIDASKPELIITARGMGYYYNLAP